MNILIKLTCLIGLVIAPILGNGAKEEKGACCAGEQTEMSCADMGKCDMTKCATMTKDECAAMCESNGCSAEQKAKCMAMYDENGNYIAKTSCVDMKTGTAGTVDPNGNYIYDLGASKTFNLPDGKVLNVGDKSIEYKLFNFLNDNNVKVSADKTKDWMSLDRTYFVSGKTELTKESNEQIANIAAILKSFPNAKVKIGGYTDNTGALATNMKISGERAKFVMDLLVKGGVPAANIAAEGYGPEHPICAANDTKECQAQNRRVDIRVKSK